MFTFSLIFLSSFISTGQTSLNQEQLENAFFNDVINERNVDSNTLLQLLPKQLAFICKRIFQTGQYKYQWKIHLNELAYNQMNEEFFRFQLVTFIDPETESIREIYANQMFLYMSPCFGHHRPIRSDLKLDDYYEKFFVSPALNWDIIYIFRMTTRDNGEVIFLVYDRILLLEENKKLPSLEISTDHLQKYYKHLNEVTTINYDSNQVEAIYFREMIQNQDSFQDQLFELDIAHLVTVCWSIFTEKIFIDNGFIFNQNDMFSHGWLFRRNSVKLLSIKHGGRLQNMHPCRGQFATNPSSSSFDYRISSGRRINSIFIYIKFQKSRNKGARPIYFVENFDFTNLQP